MHVASRPQGHVDAVIGVDTHRDRHAAALLDPNGGCGPPWRCQATRPATPGCCGWPRSRPRAGGSGPWKGPAVMGRADPVPGRPGRVGGRDRPAHAAPRPPRREERCVGRGPGRPRSPRPQPPHHTTPARAPGGPSGAAHHPRRHRGRRRRRPPPAQGSDRHRPRAAAGPPAGRPWRHQLRACAELVAAPGDPVEHRATMRALALTAERALAARQDAHQLEAELRQLVTVMAPALLTQPLPQVLPGQTALPTAGAHRDQPSQQLTRIRGISNQPAQPTCCPH
jgi:hypothetical protein